MRFTRGAACRCAAPARQQFLERIAAEAPHVLTFDTELLIDGRTLERPVNFGLARIVPAPRMTSR